MEVIEIYVSKGVTISVGKFESVRLDAAIKITPQENDDYDTVFDTAYEIVSDKIIGQAILMKGIIDKGSFIHELMEGAIETKVKNKQSSSRRRR